MPHLFLVLNSYLRISALCSTMAWKAEITPNPEVWKDVLGEIHHSVHSWGVIAQVYITPAVTRLPVRQ